MFLKPKFNLAPFVSLLFVFSCAQEEKPSIPILDQNTKQQKLIPETEIDQVILRSLKKPGILFGWSRAMSCCLVPYWMEIRY